MLPKEVYRVYNSEPTDMAAITVESMTSLAGLLGDVPVGNWVALSHNEQRVVAFAPDLADVMTAAKQSGEHEAVYYFNADDTEGQFIY